MITSINFANGYPYERFRKYNSFTAKWFGKVDRVIEYSKDDIPDSYITAHKEIFAESRGYGLWLWKPFLISKTLQQLKYDDWLFYVDSGAVIINDVHKLVNCAEENKTDIMLFEMPLLDRQFTKKECYEKIGVKDYNQNQLAATYVLVKKTKETTLLIKEWLTYCEDVSLLSGNHFYDEINEFDDFFSHREDQSILTLLRIKYDLPVFRDCSDYGEFPHMYFCSQYGYNAKQYTNSTFPTIVLSNRKKSPIMYFCRYVIKSILYKIGMLKSEEIIKYKIQNNL